jgi:hypothetical protein
MSTGTWTASINTAAKTITQGGPLATYEQRAVQISPETTATLPAGNYAMEIIIGGLVVARNALTLSANKLNGTVDLNTTEMANYAAMKWRDTRLTAVLSIWDATNGTLWAQGFVDIHKTKFDTSSTAASVPSLAARGSETIAIGEDSVEVNISVYGFTSAPSQVFGSVETPTGGTALLIAQPTAISADALTFALTSATPEAGYKLHWMVMI